MILTDFEAFLVLLIIIDILAFIMVVNVYLGRWIKRLRKRFTK